MEEDHRGNKGRSNVADVPLFPLEVQRFHEEYKKYFQHKRGNFFKAITGFSDLWDCCQLLNDIWMREMADLEVLRDQYHLLPRMIFTAAHSRIVTALELGFSCCIGDAYSILRDGIESATHAHKIFVDPNSAAAWSEKENGTAEKSAYDRIFTHNKKENLFPEQHGLRRLHVFYAQFSEMATHSGVSSVGKSFKDMSTPEKLTWGFSYFETDPKKLALFLLTILVVASYIEEAFYACYEVRLNLDNELVAMRSRFIAMREQQRTSLRTKYDINSLLLESGDRRDDSDQ